MGALRFSVGVFVLLVCVLLPLAASAQWFGSARQLTTGEEIYVHICRSCHMPEGRGASSGVVTAPRLANDARLGAPAYPIMVILNGKTGMPWFNGTLSPQQIALVTNYIRTHFGNSFTDTVTEEDVRKLAGPVPRVER